jgi:RimJ/RimL family protein N-acetyltransferase
MVPAGRLEPVFESSNLGTFRGTSDGCEPAHCMIIKTPNLRLLPYPPEYLLALLVGRDQFDERIGHPAADGLSGFLVGDAVSPTWIAQLRATHAGDPWIHGFAVIHQGTGAVIGNASFKAPPDTDGMVEIGYGIVPTYQGRGYATEAARALVALAFEHDRVSIVRAHTAPTPNDSTRVLAKCGFKFTAAISDREDGLIWRWDRSRFGNSSADEVLTSFSKVKSRRVPELDQPLILG